MSSTLEVTWSDSRRGNTPATATPPGSGSPAPPSASSPAGSLNPAMQLQQYKQRLQLMNQQLRAGQQQLKELQKNPSNAQNVGIIFNWSLGWPD